MELLQNWGIIDNERLDLHPNETHICDIPAFTAELHTHCIHLCALIITRKSDPILRRLASL